MAEDATAAEVSVARRLWSRSHKDLVTFAKYTPLVVCLTAGELYVEAFHQYLAQDVHLFRAFASAYELAAESAAADDDKVAILGMRKATLEELKLFDSVMKEWGFDPNEDITPNPTTVRYTDFVLGMAQNRKVEGGNSPLQIATPFEKTKIAAYAVGVMTPCMKLYAHLAKELQTFEPPDGRFHPYKKWIDHYASESFAAAAVQIEELLDKLSIPLTKDELDIIGKLYRQAMELQIEFFSAQPIAPRPVVPLTKLLDPAERLFIFSDFDLTCTVVDSFEILKKLTIFTGSKIVADAKENSSDMKNSWIATSNQYSEEYQTCIESLLPQEDMQDCWIATSNQYSEEYQTCIEDLLPKEVLAEITTLTASKTYEVVADAKKNTSEMRNSWIAISNQYSEEFQACIERLLPKEVSKFDYGHLYKSLEQLGNYGHLYKSLEQLGNFEIRANSRVVESGMLKGVNLGFLKSVGERMKFHDGCKEFFQKIVKKKEMLTVDLHIISYCWCADFIRSAFSSVGCLKELTIHSNELNFEGYISMGEIDIKFQSPMDKVEAFTNVLNQSSSENHLSVYIGNSVADLLCLLKADIGIVVESSNTSIWKVGKQFGVSFIPLFPGMVDKQRRLLGDGSSEWKRTSSGSGILFTASSWSEIQAFILGA